MKDSIRDQDWQWLTPLLLVALLLVRVRVSEQWDFGVYYYGALAARHGLTPYDAQNLTAMQGGGWKFLFPYMYPPLTLWIFKPLLWFSFGHAKAVWLGIKLGVVAGLVVLWQRRFVPKKHWLAWAAVLAIGFNSALYREVRSGNFELFVELLIWIGLAAWLARRYWLFCAFIVLAAIFKLAPLLLLGLLFVEPGRAGRRYFAGALLGFGVLLGVSYLSAPGDFLHWLSNVSRHDEELGMRNPCTLAFFREIAIQFSTAGQEAAGKRIAGLAYLVVAASVGLSSLWTVWRGRDLALTEDRRKLLLFGTLATYAVVLPRFMVYSYVLLLVPAFFIAVRRPRVLIMLLVLFALHDVADKLLGLNLILPSDPYWTHASPLVLLGIWLGFLIVNYGSLFFAVAVWAMYRGELQPSRIRQPEAISAA